MRRLHSGTWPAPLKNVIAPLLNNSFQKVEGEMTNQQQAAIETGPGELCRSGIEGHYPLSESEQEVSLNQFERFFGAGGALDTYFQAHLADSVDSTASPWRYKGRAQGEGLDLFEQGAGAAVVAGAWLGALVGEPAVAVRATRPGAADGKLRGGLSSRA
ncbi:hypothetical protein NMY27_05915 [Cronobacter dublinensis subsp. beijingensis]|uniref:hypothetical protein n=1 Tax=Cronobacter dublinensis TaxID=413497 RepID=UPI0023DB7197|nr:hypothetical protein [Cronobacter dublinensis]WEP50735.1 hypothetical protein NMY27_05915 [Cronobacter dublinensis]